MSDNVSKDVGLTAEHEYQGRVWRLRALTLRDMTDFARTRGSADGPVNINDADDQHLVLWLMLRKADPELTTEQKQFGSYRLMPSDVEDMFTLKALQDPATPAFIAAVIEASGYLADTTDTEAPAEPAATKKPKAKPAA